MTDAATKTGLILTGGGARAAYQVGVLRAIAEVWQRRSGSPFPILCGTSAGAINAAALACNADNFRKGVSDLLQVWRSFEVAHVYRADPWGIATTGARWLTALMLGGLGRSNPASLFDNAPLRGLLESRFAFERLAEHIRNGDLYALAVNATGYTSGQSVTFYEGSASAEPWTRARRLGVHTWIGLNHLMASSAIPFVFPAVRIHREYFGDGSMRQIAPISPALHLGADRVLVVAVGRLAKGAPARQVTTEYPSMAQIAGHVLSSIFLDSLEVDLERLQRINRTVGVMPAELRARHGVSLKHVDTFVIAPSEDIEPIAARFAHRLPRTVRFFLRGIGATKSTGSNLLSYLLFDRAYCRALIGLGYRDAMARRDELAAFIAGSTQEPQRAAQAGATTTERAAA
jgi:NTE family protein